MGRVGITIDDNVETNMRKKVYAKGYKQGDLSKYIEGLIIRDLKKKVGKKK